MIDCVATDANADRSTLDIWPTLTSDDMPDRSHLDRQMSSMALRHESSSFRASPSIAATLPAHSSTAKGATMSCCWLLGELLWRTPAPSRRFERQPSRCFRMMVSWSFVYGAKTTVSGAMPWVGSGGGRKRMQGCARERVSAWRACVRGRRARGRAGAWARRGQTDRQTNKQRHRQTKADKHGPAGAAAAATCP